MAQINKVFADSFAICCVSYDQAFNPEKAKIFFDMLSGYSAEQISKAFKAHMLDPDRGRFFPKIADIIHQINKQSPGCDYKTSAELEWAKCLKAASAGRKPNTDDQFCLAALQMIGGPNLVGYADASELGRIKRNFIDSYLAVASCKRENLPQHLDNIELLNSLKTGVAVR